ncbi:MAG TPA: hypothetical protein VD997_16500 [Phycisphaerales bacterium]|nr:hypothetical protein [Phycisphaerales bacterium]
MSKGVDCALEAVSRGSKSLSRRAVRVDRSGGERGCSIGDGVLIVVGGSAHAASWLV